MQATRIAPLLSAPPASAFPQWPFGWYFALNSNQVTRTPVGFELFGRNLVCFRSSSGKPVTMEAHCWHLGADLSRGSLIDSRIVCPFHGWRYSESGDCVHIPCQAEIPSFARQRTYCTTEFAGRIFVFPAPQSAYPLPFFPDTDPADLLAAPAFEFLIDCPWWLVGANGFDLQHFAKSHDRRITNRPLIETPVPAARRIRVTFEVCGTDWRDHATRQFAGRYVTLDATVWSGTLAFVISRFHKSPDSGSWRSATYGMTEIRPVPSAPDKQSIVRVTIFCRHHKGLAPVDWLAVRLKRDFVHAFLKPDTLLLRGAQYDPDHLIDADRQLVDYLRWLALASRNHFTTEEPL